MPYVQTVNRATTRYRVKWSDGGVRRSRNFAELDDAQAFAAALDVTLVRTRASQGRSASGRGPKRKPIADRIGRLVAIDAAGCWIWKGNTNNAGYGQLLVMRRMALAHRVSYEEFVGPIPAGLVLDHLCRVRHCVNPLHLEPVTQRENVLRSPIAQGALNAAKTHCPKGHPYDEANTYVHVRPNTTTRICRACSAAHHRRYVERKRAARQAVSA